MKNYLDVQAPLGMILMFTPEVASDFFSVQPLGVDPVIPSRSCRGQKKNNKRDALRSTQAVPFSMQLRSENAPAAGGWMKAMAHLPLKTKGHQKKISGFRADLGPLNSSYKML